MKKKFLEHDEDRTLVSLKRSAEDNYLSLLNPFRQDTYGVPDSAVSTSVKEEVG